MNNKKKGLLLIEISTEELPIYNLKLIGKDFIKYFSEFLNLNFFKYFKIKYFISLRRISCLVFDLYYYQKLNKNYIKIYGPKFNLNDKLNIYCNIIIDNWIKKNNFIKKNILFKDKNNFRIFYYKKIFKNKSISFFLKNNLLNILLKLKLNRIFIKWGKYNFNFIRPVNNICVLFNKKIINLCLFGLKSNNKIRPNRFLFKSNNNYIKLNNSKEYLNILKKKGMVIIDYNNRKKLIINYINNLLKIKNLKFNNKLFINESVSLVEWPVVKICKFNKDYLFLPKNLIEYILKKQYCLCLYDYNNNLTNNFIIVLDINKKYYKNILYNYVKIIESKLNDSFFLLLKDIKYPLINNFIKLKYLVFHKNLGNYLYKIKRLLFISKYFSYILNLKIDFNLLNKSIILCKCDLVTNLYKDFSILKGFLGYYLNLKKNNIISLIIKDHYCPNFYNDIISNNIYSNIISLCDKLDTFIGISLLNNYYFLKKSNDPYCLRRICLSLIKIIIFNKFNFNFKVLIKYIVKLFDIKKKYDLIIIYNFIFKRCLIYFINLGYKKNLIISFINIKLYNILEIKNRMDFLIYFKKKYINYYNYILKTNLRILNIVKNYIKDKFFNLNHFNNENDFIFLNSYYNFKSNSLYLISKYEYKLLFNLYYNFSLKINKYLDKNKIFILNDFNLTKFRINLLNNIILVFLFFVDFKNLLIL